MASKVEICNIALGFIGISKEIQNLDTENSNEANACRRLFDTIQDEVLRDFKWPFAKTRTVLELIEEAPDDEWNYSYRYPTDCVRIHRIPSGIRMDNRQSAESYELRHDSTGTIIYADAQNAELIYTKRVDDPNRWPPDFRIAFAHLLASRIAMRLSGADDPYGHVQNQLALYLQQMMKAQGNAQDETVRDEEPLSEFERDRA